jgi:hypothetical protein
VDVFEYISTKFEAWLEDWAAVAFRPKQYFRSGRGTLDTAMTFVIGVELFAYMACLICSIGFFALYFREYLAAHLRATSTENIVGASKLFFAVAAASVTTVLVSTLLTFAIARLLGSTAPLSGHVAANCRLVALDPVAVAGATLILLSNAESWPALIGVVLFVAARLWQLLAGYYAMAFIHPLRPLRRAALLLFGFLPSFIILNVLVVALTAFAAMFAIAGWD